MVIDELIKKGCWVHEVKGGYRLDQSLSSKILNMVLLMAAEIERKLISKRSKEALADARLMVRHWVDPGVVMVYRYWISKRTRYKSTCHMV